MRSTKLLSCSHYLIDTSNPNRTNWGTASTALHG
jgi:hypothetical protein